MKKYILLVFIITTKICVAQNVGIGTLTPTSKLNVNGQVTIDQKNFGGYGGLLLKGDAPGNNYPNIAFTIKNNAAAPVDEVGAMIQGDLQNNAAGAETIDLTFLNSQSGLIGLTEKMRIKANGNVGIGTGSPGFPLNFASAIGDKISLYGNAGDHYGFGIQGGLLQMHSGVITDDIAFGYGSSSSFNENMRIKGNGNVGIGTSSPQAYGHGGNNKILEIKNSNVSANSQAQLILSTGAADGSMGGITWAQHNVLTEKIAGFLGCVLNPSGTSGSKLVFYTRSSAPANLLTEKMTINGNGHVGIGQPNPAYPLNFASTLGDKISLYGNAGNHYGFGVTGGLLQIHSDAPAADIAFGYGSSASFTERFRVKGNGALAVGGAGNTGVAGQILTSNGTGGAPSWVNQIKYGSSAVSTANINIDNTLFYLTASEFSINLNVPSRIFLNYKVRTTKPCSLGTCLTKWQLTTEKASLGYWFPESSYFITGESVVNIYGDGIYTDTNLGPDTFDLPAGVHSFRFRAYNLFNLPEVEFQAFYTIVPL
jgi:hypothetical protein